jgi:hypothetical protein
MYQTDMELLGQHIVRIVFPKKSVVRVIFKSGKTMTKRVNM